MERFDWKLPSRSALLDIHPCSKRPLLLEVVATTGSQITADASLSDNIEAVGEAWPDYLQLMGWWQMKRYFNRAGPSIKCKSCADVVVVHSVGRFTTAQTAALWRDASYWNLLAHCNYGAGCATFTDSTHLETSSDADMDNLVTRCVAGKPDERAQARM